jgi:ribonuclease BN (tRNA processing enzyme)
MASLDTKSLSHKFGRDELLILGSGGGRYNAVSQKRSTGGFILRAFNGKVQCHIDPGPGAIRDVHKYQARPEKTNYIFLTHRHNDHCMSIPIIIEALQDDLGFKNKKGKIVAPEDYISSGQLDSYYNTLLERIIPVHQNESHHLEPGFRITTTPTKHGNVQNVGYIMEFGPIVDYHYKIAFTSDTAYFDNYVDIYKGVDILVVNLLRPNDHYCQGHLCTDELIPLLREIHPRICVLTHLGAHMNDERQEGMLATQVRKIQNAMPKAVNIIGAEDGMLIQFANS